MSTVIQPGLEIRRLNWKDDAFRQADWWDFSVNNAITFSNGTVTTGGAYGPQSSVVTDGDLLYLPNGQGCAKYFGLTNPNTPAVVGNVITIPAISTGSLRFRARNDGTGTASLVITLLDGTLTPIVGMSWTINLTSSLFTHYTQTVGSPTDIGGITVSVSNHGCYIDYLALASCDYINRGGQALDITVPKRTDSLKIPNAFDVIQQLGIAARSYAVDIPKASITNYVWLDGLMTDAVPIEIVTQTLQTTGYLSDIKRHTEAGWVGIPSG